MISHQQARRNLSAGELIFANSMVAEEIALENKEKISKAVSESNKNRALNPRCVQMDANETKTRDRSTNTREQVAKLSGVGVGTVARYDAVMKSDDEILADLLETNIRQRGDVGGSAKKVGLRIKELERLYGVQNGGDRKSDTNKSVLISQSDIASKMGISVDTLQDYKLLAEMIPELEELMEWMLDIQLGRRNLSPIQRIAIAEKYRSIYEKQALINK